MTGSSKKKHYQFSSQIQKIAQIFIKNNYAQMNSLQCVGRPSEVSSKVNEKEVAPLKHEIGSSADPEAKESVEWKSKQHKPLSGRTEGLSVNSETTNMKLKAPSSTRQMKANPGEKTEGQDPSINSSLNSNTTSDTTLKVHTSKSSRGYNASKALSFRNVTRHGHKLPKQVPPIMTALEKQECDVQSESVHELHIQAPQVELSVNDQHPHGAQSEEDGNESAEGHVPLELFAEFLQAIMTKNYQLAKKLCQMILIYEPQNSEAKNFLPLIEEKLLIEVDEESDDGGESDTSDDEDDDVEDDDDESSDDESSDTEESSDSTDDTLSSSS